MADRRDPALPAPRLRQLARAVAALAVVLAARSAAGDGKVFPKAARVPVPMVDQRALLCWQDGTETLVIASSFAGVGTDFAWVVPLPAVPEISAVDAGALTTLAVVFQPAISHAVTPFWSALGIVALAAFVGAVHQPTRRYIDRNAWGCLALGLLVGLLVASLMVPMLSTASLTPTPRTGVRILATSDVGDYALVTLAGNDARALAAWLRDGGYDVPDAALPAIAAHVERNGVFVAAKLRRELATERVSALHPLRFCFSAASPVYPMALTGAGATTPLDLELYVFGPQRAEVRGMRTARCSRAVPAERSRDAAPRDGLVIGHPELLASIGEAAVATRLVGTLDPAAMQGDLDISWARYAPSGEWAYTRGAAIRLSLDVAVGIGCILLCGLLGLRPTTRFPRVLRPLLVIGAVCGAAGLAVFAALPTYDGPIQLVDPRDGIDQNRSEQLALRLIDLGYDEATRFDRAWFDAAVAHVRDAGHAPADTLSNAFTGVGLALEASPGNLTVRRRPDGTVEICTYDATGTPSVFLDSLPPSMPPRSP